MLVGKYTISAFWLPKKKNGTFFLWFDRRIQIALSYVDDTFGCGYDPKAQVLIKS